MPAFVAIGVDSSDAYHDVHAEMVQKERVVETI